MPGSSLEATENLAISSLLRWDSGAAASWGSVFFSAPLAWPLPLPLLPSPSLLPTVLLSSAFTYRPPSHRNPRPEASQEGAGSISVPLVHCLWSQRGRGAYFGSQFSGGDEVTHTKPKADAQFGFEVNGAGSPILLFIWCFFPSSSWWFSWGESRT